MSDRTAKRAREIYLELATLDENAVNAELDRLAGDDPELREAVISLIDAEARADGAGFMSSPTASTTAMSATITETAGTVIGRYKLLQLIGEGGFGSVFLAEQSRPVRRRVALKIIKLGMDTKQVIARFEAERQALAMMDHPHIARVYDAGATETGRPYFAMEYVVGDAITRFADAHKLSIPERLALFAQVCSAVQHAHTKGVIHRDLKPANVLVSMVDGKPYAKVIDFGIAKATASPLTEKTLFTEHRQLIGTPEYMSPEQAEGSPDIDTRTDVYALGVLLYELLTGVTPFDGKRLLSAGFGEMQRIIKEEDPPAPSLRLTRNLESLAQTAMARQVEPAKLSTVVRGELDWIVMKALDKDRGRRYESAAQLAMDIGNHLAGEAVVAAPPSRGYRVRKFVRRNKGAVIAGSAVSAALLLGLAGTAWGWMVAKQANSQLTDNWRISEDALNKIVNMTSDGDITIKAAMAPGEPHHSRAVSQISDVAVGSVENVIKLNQLLESSVTSIAEEAASLGGPLPAGGKTELGEFGSFQIEQSLDPDGQTQFTVNSTGQGAIFALQGYARQAIRDAAQRAIELQVERDRLQRQADIARESMIEIGSILDGCECGSAVADGFYEGWLTTEAAEPYLQESDSELLLRALGAFGRSQSKQLIKTIDEAEWSSYTANLALAQLAMDAGNYPEARKRLADCPEGKRGWEWHLANLQSDSITHHIRAGGVCVPSPTDSRIAIYSVRTYSNENEVYIYDGTDYEEPITIRRTGTTEFIYSVSWKPDGTQLLLLTSDGVAHIYSSDGAGGSVQIKGPKEFHHAEWNHDGSRILTANNTSVQIWNSDGTHVCDLAGSLGDTLIRTAAWSPKSDTVAVQYDDGRIDTIDPDTREAKTICPASDTHSWSMKWSPNGSRIVAYANSIYAPALLVSADGAEPIVFQHTQPDAALCAQWNPDGNAVIIGHSDRSATIIDVSNLTERQLEGMHSWGVLDVAWSNDGKVAYTSSLDGICAWDTTTCTPIGTLDLDESDDEYQLSIQHGSQFLIVSNDNIYNKGPLTRILPIDAYSSYDRMIRRHMAQIPFHLYIEAMASSAVQDSLSGVSLVTPDGTRRIEAQGRTLRFYDESTGREVATHGFESTITNLLMTGDGSRLVIELTNTNPRVWDIRTQEEQANDIQARWRERVPAGEYLDELWDSQTPTDALMDEVIADRSLTPLRRLVAAEMLDERISDMNIHARVVMNQIKAGKTDKQEVLDLAASADVHPRVREVLLSLAAEWEYTPPKADADELLAEEQKKRALAEATIVIREFTDRDAGGADDSRLAMLNLDAAVATRREYLGLHHPETIEAELVAARESDLSNDEWIDKLIDLSERLENSAETGRDELRIEVWSYLAWRHWYRGDIERSRDYMTSIGTPLPIAFAIDPLAHYQVVNPSWPCSMYNLSQPNQDEVREISDALDSITALSLYRSRADYGYRESDFTTCSRHIELVISQCVKGYEDPRDFALLAMSRYKLGEIELAEEAIVSARNLLEDPTAKNRDGVPWAQDRDAIKLVAVAEKLLEGLPERAE